MIVLRFFTIFVLNFRVLFLLKLKDTVTKESVKTILSIFLEMPWRTQSLLAMFFTSLPQ